MLTIDNARKIDATLSTYEAAKKTAYAENRKERDEAISRAAQAFRSQILKKDRAFKVEGLEGVAPYERTTYTAQDGNNLVSFMYDGETRVYAVRASLSIYSGTLSYTLRFYESGSWVTKDWVNVYGTGKITPVISAEFKTSATQGTEGGEYTSYQSLAVEVERLSELLLGVAGRVREDAMSENLRDEYLGAYNDYQEQFRNQLVSLNGLVEQRWNSVRLSLEEAKGNLFTEIQESLREGWSAEGLRLFFEDVDLDLELDYNGDWQRRTFGRRRTMSNIINSLNEDEVLTLLPPKRKNSKNVWWTKTKEDGEEVMRSTLDRQEFEFELRTIAEHIAVQNMFNLYNIEL